jgi:hypothetical protein
MVYEEKLRYFLEKLKGEFSILEIEKLLDEMAEAFPKIDELLDNCSQKDKELGERLLTRSFYKRLSVYESYINQ